MDSWHAPIISDKGTNACTLDLLLAEAAADCDPKEEMSCPSIQFCAPRVNSPVPETG
jgi:hypothetical protein